MASAGFGKLPPCVSLDVRPFEVHVLGSEVRDFKQLLRLSPVGAATFENSQSVGRRYGIQHEWLINAKDYWLNNFDWRAEEEHINWFPNFTATVNDFSEDKVQLNIHFIALFSEKADAVPLVLYHGWPGSFMEFFPILRILTSKYTRSTLPYHIIVPSLPGYAFSSSPPHGSDFTIEDAALALDSLMRGLGFSNGYIAQGGDLGSSIARYQAANCDSCKGMHVNYSPIARPENADDLPLLDIEREALPRVDWFKEVGAAYAIEHGTRAATIGHVLSASPLALLSWMAEKFLDWSDEDPSLDLILADVTLYWFTETFPRCIYPYRDIQRGDIRAYVSKPSGYSFFPKELMPMPISWVATSCNLVSAVTHTSGGHFAALEKPDELLSDIEGFIKKVLPLSG
ncbi:Alpha/Beta hydrolase protein [Xylariales sp. AK1849]|nr:Alpha/Beta hydrolase protein [Xylariales sp. AK1849]